MKARVRIAPSPTGEPHIGTARTALFNWLFARHTGGAFVVRIEDTDRNRLVPGAVESVMEMLRWLGLDPDEGPDVGGEYGPYFESQRLELYHREIQKLLDSGRVYRCYCSPERLQAVNAEKARNKQPPGYDRCCRSLIPEERAAAEASGVTPVVRLAVPLDGTTTVDDYIRGPITFENAVLQDAVLLKSDGYPTYHLAAIVDDHYMKITHVMRGDEWVSTAPLHMLVYQAFGWTPPVYAHLPLILGKDKAKLSKRHGDTAFMTLVEQGYLPEALFNFLGLLGWSLDDKTEIISREQFVKHFSLDRIVKNPAVFDFDKLNWMNGQYIRMLPPERFADLLLQRLRHDLPPELAQFLAPELVTRIAPLLQERIERLDQAAPMLQYFFAGVRQEYDTASLLGKRFAGKPDDAAIFLDEACAELADAEDWVGPTILETLRKLADRGGYKMKEIDSLVRVAITGRQVSPPLPESMEILGKPLSLDRLGAAVERLRQ